VSTSTTGPLSEARTVHSSVGQTSDTADRFCIIGAGPAGLSAAAAFKECAVPYDHLERHAACGGIWDMSNPGTPMYESAHFISSKTLSAFPGFPMPDDYPDYPRHDLILRYVRSFAEQHRLTDSIQFGSSVSRVIPGQDHAEVVVNGQSRIYRGVVCASGMNWEPLMPTIEGRFNGEVRHAATYTSRSEFAGKRVLIVGLGNSGADIASDAAQAAKEAWVSIRRGYYFIPKYIFGKPADVFGDEGPPLPHWLEQLGFELIQRLVVGDTRVLGMPKPDHRLLSTHPLTNDQLLHHLRHGDIHLRPDVLRFEGNEVVFKDGSRVAPDLVLLATGYRRRISYLDSSFLDGETPGAQLLTCFSRKYPSLFTLGLMEVSRAAYPHFGRLAALVAQVARARLQDPEVAASLIQWLNAKAFDLGAGRKMVTTERHLDYCDDKALEKATRKAFKKMGWPCP